MVRATIVGLYSALAQTLFLVTDGFTREDPSRCAKTMSCFYAQKWSRVKALAQWLGATYVGQLSSRNGLAGQGPVVDICRRNWGVSVQRSATSVQHRVQHRAKRCKFSEKRTSVFVATVTFIKEVESF